MALSAARHRRPSEAEEGSSRTSDRYSKDDKPEKKGSDNEEKGLGWAMPLMALGLLRYMIAMRCSTTGNLSITFSTNQGSRPGNTGFLPSTFSMYAVTLSSSLYLLGKYSLAVSVAAAGVILGWPFSILVVFPVTIYSLINGRLKVFLSGLVTSVFILGLSILVDYYCYGRWKSSVFNLLHYNVLGGGERHLYGIEGPLFYLRNGFNNFNLCFVLALLFLLFLKLSRKKYAPDLLIVVSPIYIWLAFMSLQAHKEERFLYPIYPLICAAPATVIESFPDLFRDKYAIDDSIIVKIAKVFRPIILGLILCVSHSRTFSLLHGYSAPMEIYKHLDYYEDAGNGSVLCVGSEWHRYPSSFFVPS